MYAVVELIRSLKVVGVVLFVCSTVWVLGWERNLSNRVESGLAMPAPSKAEVREMRQRRGEVIERRTQAWSGAGRAAQGE